MVSITRSQWYPHGWSKVEFQLVKSHFCVVFLQISLVFFGSVQKLRLPKSHSGACQVYEGYRLLGIQQCTRGRLKGLIFEDHNGGCGSKNPGKGRGVEGEPPEIYGWKIPSFEENHLQMGNLASGHVCVPEGIWIWLDMAVKPDIVQESNEDIANNMILVSLWKQRIEPKATFVVVLKQIQSPKRKLVVDSSCISNCMMNQISSIALCIPLVSFHIWLHHVQSLGYVTLSLG